MINLSFHLAFSGAGSARGRIEADGPRAEAPGHRSGLAPGQRPCLLARLLGHPHTPRVLRLAPNLKVRKTVHIVLQLRGTS